MNKLYSTIRTNGKLKRLERFACRFAEYCPKGNFGTNEKCRNYEECERYIASVMGRVVIEVVPFGPCRGSKRTLLEEEMGWKLFELNPNPGF